MNECNDPKCPLHGHIKVRGNIFEGKVIRMKSPKTVVIERILIKRIPKFERYKKIRSRIAAYMPDCMKDYIKVGDTIKIGETRKLSKTKSFVVLKKSKEQSGNEKSGEVKK